MNIVTPVLEEWLRVVRQAFEAKPPDGRELGWDEARMMTTIGEIASPLHINNWTAFDYAFCNRYEIKVPGEAKKEYLSCSVRLSFIVPAYTIHWTSYWRNGKSGKVVDTPEPLRGLETRIRQHLEKQGFIELPEDWQDIVVLGISLELAGARNVTLGKCLFEDYDG